MVVVDVVVNVVMHHNFVWWTRIVAVIVCNDHLGLDDLRYGWVVAKR